MLEIIRIGQVHTAASVPRDEHVKLRPGIVRNDDEEDHELD